MKIQAYLDFRLIQASCISGMYSHIHNPRYIEVYLLTFGRILTDSVIFRILTQLDIFMFNKAYSKPTAHSGTFRNVDIFSQFHAGYSGTQEAIYAYSEPRLAYLEPWLIQARNVSRIFKHIHKVKHIEEYLPTLGHISAESGIFRIILSSLAQIA